MFFWKKLSWFCLLLLATSGVGCSSGCASNLLETPSPADDDSGVEDPNTWENCGGALGDHPCNFTLLDQNGEDWTLYDHYGDVVVITFSTGWCHWSQVVADRAQALQDNYSDQGLVWTTILIEDASGGEVTDEVVQAWITAHNITSAPVLAGDRSIIDVDAETGFPVTGWPTIIVIDKQMIIAHAQRGWSEEQITTWIEEEL